MNLKYFWKNHRSLCLLTWCYVAPAILVYVLTRDSDLSRGAGAVGVVTGSPFIWKFL